MEKSYFIIAMTCAIITGILSFVLTDKRPKATRMIIKILISIFFCGAVWYGILDIANTYDVSLPILFESKHLSMLVLSGTASVFSSLTLLLIAQRYCAIIICFIQKKKRADSDIDIDILVTSVFTALFIGCSFIYTCFAAVLMAAIATIPILLWLAWISD